MRYMLLAYGIVTSVSLHGYFTETVATWDTCQDRSRNIYMFGDHHETGPDETRQIQCMKKLLAKKRKANPLHMLVERPLVSRWGDRSDSVLYTLPLYAQKKHIPCEDIEVRTISLAACALLNSDYPLEFCEPFTDAVSDQTFHYNTLTFQDVVNSFEQTKKSLAKKIDLYDCLPLFKKLNKGDDFLAVVKQRVGFADNPHDRVAQFASRYRGNKGELIYFLVNAFSSFIEVHTACRVQEIPDDRDIVLLAGADHVKSVAYLLNHMGAHEFHRSRRYGTYPLSNQQLDILGMQPSGLFSGYHYARQLCADSCTYLNSCCS